MPNPSAISKSQIKLWEKEGVITYLGQTHDVREFIASASCIVLPSYREGAPRVLLESMAMGKPIITSNAIGCKELVHNGINGFMCEAKNARSLAQAMRDMLKLESKQYAQMARNARKFAKTHDVKRIVKIYKATLVLIDSSKEGGGQYEIIFYSLLTYNHPLLSTFNLSTPALSVSGFSTFAPCNNPISLTKAS